MSWNCAGQRDKFKKEYHIFKLIFVDLQRAGLKKSSFRSKTKPDVILNGSGATCRKMATIGSDADVMQKPTNPEPPTRVTIKTSHTHNMNPSRDVPRDPDDVTVTMTTYQHPGPNPRGVASPKQGGASGGLPSDFLEWLQTENEHLTTQGNRYNDSQPPPPAPNPNAYFPHPPHPHTNFPQPPLTRRSSSHHKIPKTVRFTEPEAPLSHFATLPHPQRAASNPYGGAHAINPNLSYDDDRLYIDMASAGVYTDMHGVYETCDKKPVSGVCRR